MSSLAPRHFSKLVIGGGPCGILAVGTLLDSSSSLAWVSSEKDPKTIGGRFNHYDKVPGNTPTGVIKKSMGSIPALEFERLQGERGGEKVRGGGGEVVASER